MLSENAQKAIEEETSTLASIVTSLLAQKTRALERLSIESARARELTSTLVAYRRDEDKQMIASDEAVAHELRDRKEAEIKTLGEQIKQPYFARLILDEDTPQGRKKIEYRIGFAENSECRIVDWRKAPIAKLYYEYKEGEEYSEEILGRERLGTVALRNRVEIERSNLHRLSCRWGNFELRGSEWTELKEPVRSRVSSADPSGAGESSHHLPQIAALLSPEQYQLVAEAGESALLIQGIAGSGKTTIALHRLAWILGSGKALLGEPIAAERCAVIVLSAALKEYVSKALPSMGVSGVTATTLREWLGETVGRACPHVLRPASEFRDGAPLADRISRPAERTPLTVDRVKRSLAMLKGTERVVLLLSEAERTKLSPEQILLRALERPELLLQEDESKLLDKAAISLARQHTTQNLTQKVLDYADDALIVRIYELLSRGVYFRNGSHSTYQHLIADEVQDFSPVDLAAVIGAAADPTAMTLIGDTDQKIDGSSAFPGWDKLRRHWAFKESMSTFMSLNLSQRSTAQILKLADHVQRRSQNNSSRAVEGRTGRVPIWFKCLDEASGVQSSIDWLTRANQKYPGALSAVLCRSAQDAKYAYRLLQPTFGPAVRLADEYSFTFYEGIVVTGAEQVKGLEFTNVLLWNPNRKDYPRDELHRNLLYTAITRAEENLCVVSWSAASELLPHFGSALFRCHDLTIRDQVAPEPPAHDAG